MKSTIVLFVLHAILAVTLSATPIELGASSKKSLDGWYYAKASFTNDDAHLIKQRSLNVTTTDSEISSDKYGGINKRSSDVDAQITFYTGHDLLNAACYGRNGLPSYNSKDTDFIAAMRMKDFEFCFQCLRIERGHRHVIVKVIDKCGGCPQNSNNVDLTKAAFTKLATLDEGRVDIRWRHVRCPKRGRWPTFES